MKQLPYIQLYVADYLADTMHLTTIEHWKLFESSLSEYFYEDDSGCWTPELTKSK